MAKVILGVGLPGSGKTTVLKPFAEKYAYTYICPDDIRKELLGDAGDQSKNREVWEEAYAQTAVALREGHTVVFDATFAESHDRKRFIDFARAQGATKVQGVFGAVPLEVAKERNRSRERVVPDFVVERMHDSLRKHPPVVEDGFDSIVDINEFQELKRVEMEAEKNVVVKEFKPKLH